MTGCYYRAVTLRRLLCIPVIAAVSLTLAGVRAQQTSQPQMVGTDGLGASD